MPSPDSIVVRSGCAGTALGGDHGCAPTQEPTEARCSPAERREPRFGFTPCTPETPTPDIAVGRQPSKCLILLVLFGGRQEARTPDLRVANAALSQLS